MVVPQSGYHFPLSAPERIKLLLDEGSFEEKDAALRSADPLKFEALDTYANKLEKNQAKTNEKIAKKYGDLVVPDFIKKGEYEFE